MKQMEQVDDAMQEAASHVSDEIKKSDEHSHALAAANGAMDDLGSIASCLQGNKVGIHHPFES